MTVSVAEQLHLDVPRLFEQPFEIHLIVAERRLGFRARHLNGTRELGRRPNDPHALSAATGHRFHQQRIPNSFRLMTTGNDWHAGRHRYSARRRLAPHGTHRLRAGPDEGQPCLHARFGKLRVLGQEPVARMHAVGARSPRDVDHPIDPKIAFRSLIRSDGVRFVCQPDVKRIAIALRVHRNRANSHVAARPNDPHGNLAAIGNKQLVQVVTTSGSASVILSPEPTYAWLAGSW